jgi:hypothetical protein
MSRSVDDAQPCNAKLQFISIFEVFVWIIDSSLLVNIDFGASAAAKLAMARNVVGVIMCFDDCFDL